MGFFYGDDRCDGRRRNVVNSLSDGKRRKSIGGSIVNDSSIFEDERQDVT